MCEKPAACSHDYLAQRRVRFPCREAHRRGGVARVRRVRAAAVSGVRRVQTQRRLEMPDGLRTTSPPGLEQPRLNCTCASSGRRRDRALEGRQGGIEAPGQRASTAERRPRPSVLRPRMHDLLEISLRLAGAMARKKRGAQVVRRVEICRGRRETSGRIPRALRRHGQLPAGRFRGCFAPPRDLDAPAPLAAASSMASSSRPADCSAAPRLASATKSPGYLASRARMSASCRARRSEGCRGSTCTQRWAISSLDRFPARTRRGGTLGLRTLAAELS